MGIVPLTAKNLLSESYRLEVIDLSAIYSHSYGMASVYNVISKYSPGAIVTTSPVKLKNPFIETRSLFSNKTLILSVENLAYDVFAVLTTLP